MSAQSVAHSTCTGRTAPSTLSGPRVLATGHAEPPGAENQTSIWVKSNRAPKWAEFSSLTEQPIRCKPHSQLGPLGDLLRQFLLGNVTPLLPDGTDMLPAAALMPGCGFPGNGLNSTMSVSHLKCNSSTFHFDFGKVGAGSLDAERRSPSSPSPREVRSMRRRGLLLPFLLTSM